MKQIYSYRLYASKLSEICAKENLFQMASCLIVQA
jgi:hypothetical protein